MSLELFSILGLEATAITIGITQAIKKGFSIKKKLVPALALLVGVIVFMLYYQSFAPNIILGGLTVGVISVGSYNVLKKSVGTCLKRFK